MSNNYFRITFQIQLKLSTIHGGVHFQKGKTTCDSILNNSSFIFRLDGPRPEKDLQ